MIMTTEQPIISGGNSARELTEARFTVAGVRFWSREPSGEKDLKWYDDHLSAISQRWQGRWIAILSQSIVSEAGSFQEVYDDLASRQVYHALIVRVPPTTRVYRIE